MSDPGSMTYIARTPCGCLVAAAVDNPDHKQDVAREMASWVRGGLTVERVTTESIRQLTWGCAHKEAQPRPAKPRERTGRHAQMRML